jgi:hypothetical protein
MHFLPLCESNPVFNKEKNLQIQPCFKHIYAGSLLLTFFDTEQKGD